MKIDYSEARGYVADPEEWMGSLGHYVADSEGMQHLHPIAEEWFLAGLLDEHAEDEAVLAALREADEAFKIEDEAALALIAYARRGLAAGREVAEELLEAIAAHEIGDLEASERALGRAADAEREWGDDPSARGVWDVLHPSCACGCGCGLPRRCLADFVVTEYIPESLRATVEAAGPGGWGRWPVGPVARAAFLEGCVPQEDGEEWEVEVARWYVERPDLAVADYLEQVV